MPASNDFPTIFTRLKRIYSDIPGALVTADGPQDYSLNTPYSPRCKKELFLGAVQIKKNYVSFHLMPVYMFPDLLEGVSPELRKHMQGKSCFNFKQVDEGLFTELESLTGQSIARLQRENLL
jgi:hypothetical protein